MIRIVVRDGDHVLFDHAFVDSAYPAGRFGFYNYSQAGVTYRGFTVEPVPGSGQWRAVAALIAALFLAGGAYAVRRRSAASVIVLPEWLHEHRDDPAKNSWYRLEGRAERVLPVKCDPDTDGRLEVRVMEGRYALQGPCAEADIEIRDELSGRTHRLPTAIGLRAGANIVRFDLGSVLACLRTGVNRAALSARVGVRATTPAGKLLEASGRTRMLLFPILQRVLVFVPGVFGSRITVSGHPAEEAYPEWSMLGEVELNWLSCLESGHPRPGKDAIRLDLLRDFCPAEIYDVEDRKEYLQPPGLPKLLRGRDHRVPFFLMRPWPYDWRLRLEETTELLLSSGQRAEPVTPPYARPPSLHDIVQQARQEPGFDFLARRVLMVSHSTGGLVVRDLLSRAGSEDLVERAFFVDVPFWGAPKAWWVYLTGDMGITFIADSVMRDLAPNVPILYYLAPSHAYPLSVARTHVGGAPKNWRRAPDESTEGADARSPARGAASRFMPELIREARAKKDYPTVSAVRHWNERLALDADRFHRRLGGEPRIGWSRCHCFWSESGDDTVGLVYVDPGMEPGRNIDYETVPGDGTVPTVSQRADFPDSSLERIPSNPAHVPAPSDAHVWRRIVELACRTSDTAAKDPG